MNAWPRGSVPHRKVGFPSSFEDVNVTAYENAEVLMLAVSEPDRRLIVSSSGRVTVGLAGSGGPSGKRSKCGPFSRIPWKMRSATVQERETSQHTL